MPNDSGGQFPSPPTSTPVIDQPVPQETPSTPREVPLTDQIPPDLSSPPTTPPIAPTLTPPPEPIKTEFSPPIPATLPGRTPKPFPIVTILLLLISVAATAATYFFFQQNQTLNQQLIEINQTLEQQKIKDGQITPTPTLEIIITPEATTSATISATPTITNLPGQAFDQMDVIISLANQKYPNAQLLMVTASGAETATTTIIKYWFRQDQTTKRYLYVLKELGKQPSLVDQQVYVTPDNNIPSLNPQATAGTLGLDLDEAIALASATCPTTISCIANPITALFVTKDNITRWQITYKPTDGSKPYVVQIDSTTKAILFRSP